MSSQRDVEHQSQSSTVTNATDPNTVATASWRPALRPNVERAPENDDDFFERYPNATPKKMQQQREQAQAQRQAQPTAPAESIAQPLLHTQAVDEPEQDFPNLEDRQRANSISVEHVLDIRHSAASPADLSQGPSSSANASGPIERHEHVEEEEVDAVTPAARDTEEDDEEMLFKGPNETIEEQRQDLEDALPADEDNLAEVDEEQVGHPESGYDYQGEVTEMEAAQDGEPDAPLLDDEQPPPTISRSLGTDVSMGGEVEVDEEASPTLTAAKAVAAPPHIDRSFTTNFTEVPVPETEEAEEAVHEEAGRGDWSNDGKDDKTFGELLGDEEEVGDSSSQWPAEDEEDPFDKIGSTAQESTAQAPVAHDPLEDQSDDMAAPDGTTKSRNLDPEAQGGDDMAAAWEAALDDDELLELDESDDLDPSKLFGDDDDDLLEDDGDDFLADVNDTTKSISQQHEQPQIRSAPSQYQPVQQAQNPYAAASTAFLQNHGRGAGTPDTGLFDIYNTQPMPQTQQRPPLASTQSFADKSKGGYQSPYDLPMEVVKPARRRVPQPHQGSGSGSGSAPVPPPRSSSFGSTSAPLAPPGSAGSVMSPPGSRAGPPSSSGSAAAPPASISARSTPKTDSGFFADLPMSTKPRARPSGGYTPAGSLPSTPGMSGGQFPPGVAGGAAPPGPPSRAGSGYMPQQHPSRGAVQPPQLQQEQPQHQQPGYAGLRQPEKMPLLPDQPSAPAANTQPHPQVNNRYSPAPTAQAAPSSRYSPAPTAQANQSGAGAGRATSGPPAAPPPRIPSVNQYTPRTSSPLAFANEKNLPALPSGVSMSPPKVNGVGSRYSPAAAPQMQDPGMSMPPPSQMQSRQPPPPPQQQQPPMRPRTQSPVSHMKEARSMNAMGMGITPLERPTSAAGAAYGLAATQQQYGQLQQRQQQPLTGSRGPTVLPHRRQFSRDLAFHPPANPTSQDPLERWKGGPIFHWSGAGSVVTSFPSRIPFYGGGGGAGPMLKCTSGDIKVRDASTVGMGSVLVDEQIAKFPGPLAAKSKGRKKEVSAWMKRRIEALEAEAQAVRFVPRVAGEEDVGRQAEEKVMLYKVLGLFVENDGVLEGNKKIEGEVRGILVPDLEERGRVAELTSPVSASAVGGLGAEPVDRAVLAQIRQALLEGQRERAVWLAEEKKLWGHAMLLASTLGPETWRQIVQSFVRSQVLSAGSMESRSLAAAYQVFAGNGAEVVDALVPASARAGFRMVSASDGSVGSSSPLEGLEQWRETVGLVVGNRTPGDGESVARLGRLLASYGRSEAAGVCWLLGRGFVKVGGADEVDSDLVLLGGAQHKDTGNDQDTTGKAPVGADLDSILLTEIYEWASSLSSTANPTTTSSGTPYLPHLQPYKLIHAHALAASGHKVQAQAYCDHITTAYTSTTRPSQYYHPGFTQAVADLQAFLSQTPTGAEGSKGFLGLSRPGMKSVGTGVGTWFSKFVAGEEDNAAAAGQGQMAGQGMGVGAEGMMTSPDQNTSGPFGRLSGEVSRSASRNEAFNPMMVSGGQQSPYMPGVQTAVSTPGGGRYAPSYGGSAPVAVPQRPAPAGQQSTSAASSPYAPGIGSPAAGTGMMGQGMSPMEHGNHIISPLASPPSTSHSLGVPAPSDQYVRPGSAPRASSRSRYAPSPVQHGLGVQGGPGAGLNRAASDYGVPYGADSRRGSAQEIGSQGSYQPIPMLAAQQDMPAYGYPLVQQIEAQQLDTQPEAEEEGDDAFGPKLNGLGFDSEAADPSEAAGGYEPPNASAAYEPPSYQPYEPEPEAEGDDELRPKKKGMMDLDDEDDVAARAAAVKKAAADKEADDAFRKAAEADAARDTKGGKDAGKAAGGGWFKGGWFGGKKDPSADLNAANPNKPIRAKLGEESSFYYDETLKKWVNKKGGAEAATPAAATPPPPKGMSRNVSGVTGPPSGPPSRVASAAGSMGPPNGFGSRPGTSSGLPPSAMGMAMSNGGSGPPSRAGTPASGVADGNGEGLAGPTGVPPPMRPASSMSTASSLDDLLAAGPRKGGAGGTVKGKKKGRYVDVMAK
ncbi:vesicle coat component [Recurvomyces mirabilis]|uniref:vesicle coat component n=1 Tax=Recurvomyces mirabilis TaxID=574656 RepID=UPI002DE06DB8|nr:vesicle coat component [Recurvomyces mirabilis]